MVWNYNYYVEVMLSVEKYGSEELEFFTNFTLHTKVIEILKKITPNMAWKNSCDSN